MKILWTRSLKKRRKGNQPAQASFLLDRRGGILLFVAVAMVGMLAGAGLAIDAGRGFLERAQLARAVDAAALTAARYVREGRKAAREMGLAVATANGVTSGVGKAKIGFRFATNEFDEQIVEVSATRTIPTTLMRLLGNKEIPVAAAAVAAIPPVDLVFVIDQSGSLHRADAWGDLQDASRQFVKNFDDNIDQVGMVSFNFRATNHFQLSQPFTGQAVSSINGMSAVSFTNTGEGLRLAHGQFQGPDVRDRSAKVVVLFTDGRPTAFRGALGGQDRVLSAWTGPRPYGYWDNPESVQMDPTVSPPAKSCWTSRMGYCWGYQTQQSVFDQARAESLYWADRIRSENIYIYTIGLGDTSQPPGSILQIDQGFLRQIANEDGVSDPSQPDGKMYYAPDATQLRRVFDQVASDLLARLAQ